MTDKSNLVEKSNELLELFVDDLLELIRSGKPSPTDRATIARFLKDNGYSVDAKSIPQALRDMVAKVHESRKLPKPEDLPVDVTEYEET